MIKGCIVSIVRNGIYTIESFVRYHISSYDMVIGDNCSTDGTSAILDKLQEEFPGRILITVEAGDFNQKERTNKLLKVARERKEYEWVFPLDCDEFLYQEENLIKNKINMCTWRHCIPPKEGYKAGYLPSQITMSREKEHFLKKVVLPGSSISEVSDGNHTIVEQCDYDLEPNPNVLVLHMPVINEVQYSKKLEEFTRKGHKFSPGDIGLEHLSKLTRFRDDIVRAALYYGFIDTDFKQSVVPLEISIEDKKLKYTGDEL